jgi:hypothetical protein
MQVHRMIAAHPQVSGLTDDLMIRAIEACYDCAQTCTSCADACLAEPMVKDLVQCIRLDLDCADICLATGAVASRRTGSNPLVAKNLLEVCAEACRACREECSKHERMEHCAICADVCRRCEQLCRGAFEHITTRLQ